MQNNRALPVPSVHCARDWLIITIFGVNKGDIVPIMHTIGHLYSHYGHYEELILRYEKNTGVLGCCVSMHNVHKARVLCEQGRGVPPRGSVGWDSCGRECYPLMGEPSPPPPPPGPLQ